MSRWKVRLHQSHRNGALHPKRRWVVDPPGYDHKRRAEHTGNWHRAGGKWFQWGGDVSKREAWREAVAYADRMARTREVVLPRNHDLKKSVHKDINGDLYANYSSANYWAQDNWNKGPKPLALALLALAEQEEHA